MENRLRIAILTLYYNNKNYGGLLQAYALTNYLANQGYQVEQISFDYLAGKEKIPQTLSAKKWLKQCLMSMIQLLVKNKISMREQVLKQFENQISHTERVYTHEDISEIREHYDLYIAGSDQIWNLDWFYPEHFLNFVSDAKPKVSYAASMPNTNNLTDEQIKCVEKYVKRFLRVSVREEETANFLRHKLEYVAKVVLDPTLLVGREFWNERIPAPVQKEHYVFCYFLGGERYMRGFASRLASEKRIKVINVPFAGCINIYDCIQHAQREYSPDPLEFISLIRDAEYVVTDSFHGAVFANLYKKKFVCFSRAGAGQMDSRVTNLLSLFGTQDRFVGQMRNDRDILDVLDRSYSYDASQYEKMREESIAFLSETISSIQSEKPCKM